MSFRSQDFFNGAIERSTINLQSPSGFYEPLELLFIRRFLFRYCFFLSAASFGLLSHPISALTSCLIGETLPNDALERNFGARFIVHAKSDAVVIAEIVL